MSKIEVPQGQREVNRWIIEVCVLSLGELEWCLCMALPSRENARIGALHERLRRKAKDPKILFEN